MHATRWLLKGEGNAHAVFQSVAVQALTAPLPGEESAYCPLQATVQSCQALLVLRIRKKQSTVTVPLAAGTVEREIWRGLDPGQQALAILALLITEESKGPR